MRVDGRLRGIGFKTGQAIHLCLSTGGGKWKGYNTRPPAAPEDWQKQSMPAPPSDESSPPGAGGATPDAGPSVRGSRRARRSPLPRRTLLAAPLAAVVGILVVVASISPGAVPTQTPPPNVASPSPQPPEAGGYLVSAAELRERESLARQGIEPYAAAAAQLREWAPKAAKIPPGAMQPLVVKGTDNVLVDDASRAYGLGIAYALTADESYARAARRVILDWVDTSTATADTCTDNGSCQTSLIIGRAGPGFVFGADLIADSAAWTDDDRAKLRTWLATVLVPAASERINNWGDAGTFLRVVGTDYIGDRPGFDAALEKWRSLIDLIEPDGRIPEEVRRGSAGISYTQEALQYKIGVARIAERRGINLWDYVGKGGGSLRAAMDRLAYYWTRPTEWPDYPRPDVPTPGPVWEIAYAHWKEPSWVPMVVENRPYGDRGHSAIRWTTLTNGIPIEADSAAASQPPIATPIDSGPAGATSTVPPADVLAQLIVKGIGVRVGSVLGTGVPITLTWKDGSTATRFRVERSIAGGPWRRITLASDGHSATDSIGLGTMYSYRIRASEGAQSGEWATIERLRAVRLEPSVRGLDGAGAWSSVPFAEYSKGVALSTDDAGATLTWRGSARWIAVVGPTGPTRGALTVSVDGHREAAVDLFATTFRPRTTLASLRVDRGEHVVRIAADRSGSRRTVAIDDILILNWTLSDGPDSGS